MNKIARIIVGITAVTSLVVFAAETSSHSFKPKDGFVPDAKTATAIAVAVWQPIYGEERIAEQKPYRAFLTNGVWTVEGTFHGSGFGGVAVAEIAKDDGRIVRVSHGK